MSELYVGWWLLLAIVPADPPYMIVTGEHYSSRARCEQARLHPRIGVLEENLVCLPHADIANPVR